MDFYLLLSPVLSTKAEVPTEAANLCLLTAWLKCLSGRGGKNALQE